MKFNYIYFIICLFGVSISNMQAQDLSVVSGSDFNIKAGTVISTQGLDLTPSSDFSLTTSLSQNTTLSNTSISLAHINKSFKFSETTAPFSGSIKINYQDSELNNLTESNLKLLYNDGIGWLSDNTSTNNASSNYGMSTLTAKPLNELTLGIINNATTKVQSSQCGTALSSLNTIISANAVSGASSYRFKVVNGATTEIIEPTSGRGFRLTSLSGGTFYNTTYTISVSVKKNDIWGGYGDECTVTTPAFPNTKIVETQCGNYITNINSTIAANPLTGASGYRFKVVNGTTTEIIEPTSGRWFRLTSLLGGTFYNTTYTISVATRYNGIWSEYGEECTVTTPNFPYAKIQDSQCGIALPSLGTIVSANAVSNATGYKFKIVNGTSTETIDAANGSRWFRLTSLSGGALYNTTYTVSVATRYNGVWSEYGEECSITTPTATLTKLQDKQCGITLNSGNTSLLYANPVSVAQKYRFEVSLGADTYLYDTASSSVRSFRMTEVPGLTLVSGTTYSIRVAIMANGVWQPFGESCAITTYGVNPNIIKTINTDSEFIESLDFNVIALPSLFTETFHLSLTSISHEKVTIMIYDMTGKLIEKNEVNSEELPELRIGSNFAAGIYNVIVNQEVNSKTLRVIKK